MGQGYCRAQDLNTSRNTFCKEERLCSKTRIEALFAKGSSKARYPLKLIHSKSPAELKFPAQVLFVVPKRNFKKAHDRNLLRRRMREVYRQHKQELYRALGNTQLILAFVYYSKKSEPYEQIKSSMLKLLEIAKEPAEG